jgi:hypothetical protein
MPGLRAGLPTYRYVIGRLQAGDPVINEGAKYAKMLVTGCPLFAGMTCE